MIGWDRTIADNISRAVIGTIGAEASVSAVVAADFGVLEVAAGVGTGTGTLLVLHVERTLLCYSTKQKQKSEKHYGSHLFIFYSASPLLPKRLNTHHLIHHTVRTGLHYP